MYTFAYHRPSTIDEAVALMTSDDIQYLAGGQTLIPTLKQRLAMPDALVDLGGIETLKGIRRDQINGSGHIVVGAGTPHADVETSGVVRDALPALAHLASLIGDVQVRNRGTIGGSVANADPAADYPAAVIGLGATVRTNRREIAADDYFQDLFTTALEPGELITEIAFPIPEAAAYAKVAQPASGYAVAGVMVVRMPGGTVRVGVTGAAPYAIRATALEVALAADFSPAAAKAVTIPADGLNSDLHATPEYRAALVSTLAARAVAAIGG